MKSNRLANKLNSRRGASITFALMLFLVCAVVSSVVIVAGTAAAGRMSRLAESDQRYYAVTSAAKMLCDMCDSIDQDGIAVTYKKETGAIVSTEGTDAGVFADASEKLALGKTLDRTLKLESSDNPALNCEIRQTLGSDGMLVFVISNDVSDAVSGKAYTLSVTFASNLQRLASDTSEANAVARLTWKLHDIKKVRASEAD